MNTTCTLDCCSSNVISYCLNTLIIECAFLARIREMLARIIAQIRTMMAGIIAMLARIMAQIRAMLARIIASRKDDRVSINLN